MILILIHVYKATGFAEGTSERTEMNAVSSKQLYERFQTTDILHIQYCVEKLKGNLQGQKTFSTLMIPSMYYH